MFLRRSSLRLTCCGTVFSFVFVGLLFEDDDMRADARPSALERDGRQLNVGDLVNVFGWS